MTIDRRHFLHLGATGIAATAAAPVLAGSIDVLGVDAANFGLRPGSADDQSASLQRAIDECAHTRVPLAVAPGVYQASALRLPSGTEIVGIRGATKFVVSSAAALVSALDADYVTLSGLVLDGELRPLPDGGALVEFDQVRRARIVDCEIVNAGNIAIACSDTEGEITSTLFIDTADVAIHSVDARGLLIAGNTIVGAGNNGIQIWRRQSGDDGTFVLDNRIEDIANLAGGSGQYGNAVNVFRAGNVTVRGNRIRNCAFSAVRGNAASGIHIESNSVTDVREVALYAEFGFEGALIANNTVDRAAIGVSVTNFNEGGRLAVVQGNIIRDLLPRRPDGTDAGDGAGIGIAVEADTAVHGNVVENAPRAGLVLGWGSYLRNVAATANIVRQADIGIGVSVSSGAGSALIANNVVAEFGRGAILGMDREQIVTEDLMKGAEGYENLTVTGNHAG